ncbi:hypothetical protein [Gelidibacter gilvus]|uniref:hypothetical protein n=1 Tax=Gelidibacter gilvus TaxID=59602 RepID=UPI00167E80F5|nr:hypothetical protein [Gelidibacter gilvus]
MKTRYFLVLVILAMLGMSCSPDAIINETGSFSDTYATGGEHSVHPDNVRD